MGTQEACTNVRPVLKQPLQSEEDSTGDQVLFIPPLGKWDAYFIPFSLSHHPLTLCRAFLDSEMECVKCGWRVKKKIKMNFSQKVKKYEVSHLLYPSLVLLLPIVNLLTSYYLNLISNSRMRPSIEINYRSQVQTTPCYLLWPPSCPKSAFRSIRHVIISHLCSNTGKSTLQLP